MGDTRARAPPDGVRASELMFSYRITSVHDPTVHLAAAIRNVLAAHYPYLMGNGCCVAAGDRLSKHNLTSHILHLRCCKSIASSSRRDAMVEGSRPHFQASGVLEAKRMVS